VLFLIDTNIAIASDPLSVQLESGAEQTIEFLRLASLHHHDLRTHPASLHDFARISDQARRAARLSLFRRYEGLDAPPPISSDQRAALGDVEPTSNDGVDQQLLAAVWADAAGYLVSEDVRLHSRARQLGIARRVLTVADAIALLHALHADLPSPPPSVRRVKTHELDLADPIFDGLKTDYPGFAEWFRKAARSQRSALLIDGESEHAAIAILKQEPEGAHGLAGPLLKVCTFKVSDRFSGQKYGELLLKAIFRQAHVEKDLGIYLTVFEKHEQLIELVEDFGFRPLQGLSSLGELIYAKPHGPTATTGPMDPLEYHITYGPPALKIQEDRVFLIPIEPRWHRVLFPDAEPDDALFPATAGMKIQPFGNAIRKAYLCHSPSRLLQSGDTLLFYRSSDERAVYVVGVCEDLMVSEIPEEIAAAVGRRTVYSLVDITALTRTGPVLVIHFRQDRVLNPPIKLEELIAAEVVRSWPQSITRVKKEGEGWLTQRLEG
jgi:GNAT superfamily N-acetyltransferase